MSKLKLGSASLQINKLHSYNVSTDQDYILDGKEKEEASGAKSKGSGYGSTWMNSKKTAIRT